MFSTVGTKFCQILNKPSKICPRLLKLCQSVEISPNLVTLFARKKCEQHQIAANSMLRNLLPLYFVQTIRRIFRGKLTSLFASKSLKLLLVTPLNTKSLKREHFKARESVCRVQLCTYVCVGMCTYVCVGMYLCVCSVCVCQYIRVCVSKRARGRNRGAG